MKFNKDFLVELKEAFEYYKSKQIVAVGDNEASIKNINAIKIETWVTAMLSEPVYKLIAEKRINTDE